MTKRATLQNIFLKINEAFDKRGTFAFVSLERRLLGTNKDPVVATCIRNIINEYKIANIVWRVSISNPSQMPL